MGTQSVGMAMSSAPPPADPPSEPGEAAWAAGSGINTAAAATAHVAVPI
ncbi:hypothetical protein GGC64_001992 [Mycobacterium sp. OAS707]|nr:hypothetical protein [Mycobacterium sp. OAS707]MBE1547984.1 hypothetical protein [Mycobacterium sp. OAS707]